MAASIDPRLAMAMAWVPLFLTLVDCTITQYDQMRACYEAGLGRNPVLSGRVVTRFVIGRDGRVEHVWTYSNELPDCEVVTCLRTIFERLEFPEPHGGDVTVVYPIGLAPGPARAH